MLFVDPRAGSQELVKPLTDLGLPVEEMTLEFGDLYFTGRGERGAPLQIAIEHKKLPDLIQSMTNGRLQGHQLTGMLQTYDRAYLIIEGDWDSDTQGRVTMFQRKGVRRPVKGSPPAIALEKQVINLETRGGLRTRYTPNKRASCRAIAALYYYWTDKDLDEHKSHLAIHAPDLDRGLQIPVSDFRRIVSQLPGIGYATSQDVERRFGGSLRKLMLATEQDWADIEIISDKGTKKRLGASRARKIMEALQ